MKQAPIVGLFCLVMGSACAQEEGEYQNMIEAIGRSNHGRVVVFAPTISDATLANALRQARMDYIQKTNIRVLTIPYYNYLPQSTILSLALVNVPVFEAQIPSDGGMVIVDNQGWVGKNLGKFPTNNLRRMSGQEMNRALGWFKTTIRDARLITQSEAITRLKKVIK